LKRTYPSFENPKFKPETHTLAGAESVVPLLWLALFGPDDLRTDVLEGEDGRDVGTPAPLARKPSALARLPKAAARLEQCLPGLGPLEAHAGLLAQALTAAKGAYVTVELEELADAESSPQRFYERLREALAFLSDGKATKAPRALLALTGLDPRRRLVAPAELFAKAHPKKADLLACAAVLGTAHIRDVPWEKAPRAKAKATRPAKAEKLEPLLEKALEAGDEKAARELLARGADANARMFGDSTLMDPVIEGSISLAFAGALVKAGFDLTKRCGGYNALGRAVWADAGKVVAELLVLGASPLDKDAAGRTALTLAAYAGSLSCLEPLLGAGADEKALLTAVRTAEKRLADPSKFMGPDVKLIPRIKQTVKLLRARLPT
jgi:hypothetical protein